jgi:hypothetical protein
MQHRRRGPESVPDPSQTSRVYLYLTGIRIIPGIADVVGSYDVYVRQYPP